MVETAPALLMIGFAAVVIGIVLLFVASLMGAAGGKSEAAFVGFIGPIPIGFGTSKEIMYVAVALTVALAAITLLLMRYRL